MGFKHSKIDNNANNCNAKNRNYTQLQFSFAAICHISIALWPWNTVMHRLALLCSECTKWIRKPNTAA